jgi:hypothetical protein
MPKKPAKGAIVEPICNSCLWIQGPGFMMENGKKTCPAFYPDPIPEDIWQGKNGHHAIHPKQAKDREMFIYTLYDF